MNKLKKYGVVYTPKRLADFVASLINEEAKKDNFRIKSIIDPACGEGALIEAASRNLPECKKFYGIDVDEEVIGFLSKQNKDRITYINNDAILPNDIKIETKTADYWKEKLPSISAVIANPPWSSEKIYEKNDLNSAGFNLHTGQYDSYVLFMELAINIVEDKGYLGFIIPDSLFDSQNEALRKLLSENTQIRVIARLGEKIFEGINRATTVVICKKEVPNKNSLTSCFRLNTENRKQFLSSDLEITHFYEKSRHPVKQIRFRKNKYYNFDIDTQENEEQILSKIKKSCINWDQTFIFGRGVEISKKGEVTICTYCKKAQGYTSNQVSNRQKKCTFCNKEFHLSEKNMKRIIHKSPDVDREQILVGENIKRYELMDGNYIDKKVLGINYKNEELYVPPKILIRKTGLGIYASVDYGGGLTSQTVYVLRLKNDLSKVPLEYYLGILNSRVIYFYYLKMYGENEWKSHPYLTKRIIFSLPIRKYSGDSLDFAITTLTKQLSKKYSYQLDLELEKLIMDRYNLNVEERNLIFEEMNKLPNLSAINSMKFKGESRS